MKRFLYALLAIFLCLPSSAWAVATLTTSGTTTTTSYQTTEPAITNWTTGWVTTTGTTGVSGWDYVGQINGASAIYLGNGWVMTAAHVGPAVGSTFTLSSVSYTVSSVSSLGTTDLVLFKISTVLSLPSLTLTGTKSLLTAFAGKNAESQAVMIGYGAGGDSRVESWGANIVTSLGVSVSLDGYPYTTTDFKTLLGASTAGFGPNQATITNTAQVVGGDSGGADFYYNTATGKWVLVGINEAAGTYADSSYAASYMVDLSAYADEINTTISAVPEPGTWAFLGAGCAFLLWARKRKSALV